MAGLPEGSVVVCMGGTVRLVSQREWSPDLQSFRKKTPSRGWGGRC